MLDRGDFDAALSFVPARTFFHHADSLSKTCTSLKLMVKCGVGSYELSDREHYIVGAAMCSQKVYLTTMRHNDEKCRHSRGNGYGGMATSAPRSGLGPRPLLRWVRAHKGLHPLLRLELPCPGGGSNVRCRDGGRSMLWFLFLTRLWPGT